MVKGYENLFETREEDTPEEDENEREFGQPSESFMTRYMEKWGWIRQVDMVAERIRKDWDYVLGLEAVEFFNLISYCRDTARMESEAIKSNVKTR